MSNSAIKKITESMPPLDEIIYLCRVSLLADFLRDYIQRRM